MDTSEPTPPNPPPPAPERPLDAAFAAPGGSEWRRVSPALAWYRRMVLGALCLGSGLLGALLLFLWADRVWAAVWAAAALAVFAAGWFPAGRFRDSWGYTEGRTELYLTYGVLVRQLVVVPYGRMQVVDTTADLLEQALGIATVRVRTAASTADTRVVGLPLLEAVALRDRLASRSETFSTGL
ncbi:hypothetical protein SAMN05421803_112211 [Nocardiopsis flavescens]|uniref:YdbS-like PH domain-containing protein n=1 Tax=Nocardiopsis flavescens TaxID=758803 RepID=A0A1M6P1Z2_9ACTN|nr:hypothetical protein SAMN05421803_112211 [Nocardiopsis flavescens]